MSYSHLLLFSAQIFHTVPSSNVLRFSGSVKRRDFMLLWFTNGGQSFYLFIRCCKLQLLQPHLLLKKCISGMGLFCKQIKGAHVHLFSIPPHLIRFPDSHNWVREPEYPPLPMNCLAWPWPPIGRPFCHSPLLLPPSHKHRVSD